MQKNIDHMLYNNPSCVEHIADIVRLNAYSVT